MLGGLPETEARVEDQVLRRHSGAHGPLNGGSQIAQQLSHQIPVTRLGSVVHQDERHVPLGGEAGHRVVRGDAPDVVEERRARVEGGCRDRRLGSVDANRRIRQGGMDCRDGRHDPGNLLFLADGCVAGPGGLAPHVDDIGAFRDHAAGQRSRCLGYAGGIGGGSQQPVAGERVGRYVDDPHDEGAFTPFEEPAADERRRGRTASVGIRVAGGGRSGGHGV